MSAAARGFQGLNDPRVLLYFGQWSSRETYETRDTSHLARLDALCDEPPRRAYRQQLSLHEVISS